MERVWTDSFGSLGARAPTRGLNFRPHPRSVPPTTQPTVELARFPSTVGFLWWGRSETHPSKLPVKDFKLNAVPFPLCWHSASKSNGETGATIHRSLYGLLRLTLVPRVNLTDKP